MIIRYLDPYKDLLLTANPAPLNVTVSLENWTLGGGRFAPSAVAWTKKSMQQFDVSHKVVVFGTRFAA